MRLSIFDSFSEELEKIWKALEPVSQHHAFQCYKWLAFWQKTVGACVLGVHPWIGVISEDGGEPRMIFPFGTRRLLGARVLEFLGGKQSDYLGPLIHKDWIFNSSSIEAAWLMVRVSLPRHDVRHYMKLPARWCDDDNPMLKIWKSAFQDNSYSSRLPQSLDALQARLRPKFRADTTRQRKRLSKIGVVRFEMFDDSDDRKFAPLEAMIEQKRQRCRKMGVPDMFSCKAIQQFYRELPERLSDEGKIHFSVLKLDDEILAAHWGAIHRERFYFLMPTFAGEKWGTYSPGRLLLENLVEWCIQNGLKVFDFTIGGEDYKKDWCNGEMPLFEHLHVITPLGLPYFGYIWLRRRARKNKQIWSFVKVIYAWLQYGKRNG